MNRKWLGRLVSLLLILVLAAIVFGRDPSRLGNTTDLFSFATLAILYVVFLLVISRVRQGHMQTLSLGKLLLMGVGSIVASFAWLALAIYFSLPPPATVLPFVGLLLAGVAIFVICAGLALYKRVSRGH